MAKTKRKRNGLKKAKSTRIKKSTITTSTRKKHTKTGGSLVNFDNNFRDDVFLDTSNYPVVFDKINVKNVKSNPGGNVYTRHYVVQFHALKHLDTFDDFPNDFYTSQDTPENRARVFKQVCDFAKVLVENALQANTIENDTFIATDHDRGYNIVALDPGNNQPYSVTYNIGEGVLRMPESIPRIVKSMYDGETKFIDQFKRVEGAAKYIDIFSICRISDFTRPKSFLYKNGDVERRFGELYEPEPGTEVSDSDSDSAAVVEPVVQLTKKDRKALDARKALEENVIKALQQKAKQKADEKAENDRKIAKQLEKEKAIKEAKEKAIKEAQEKTRKKAEEKAKQAAKKLDNKAIITTLPTPIDQNASLPKKTWTERFYGLFGRGGKKTCKKTRKKNKR
jgi:hypothetical protein